LASGGFDVIVGNPPYVKFQYLKDFDSRGAEYLVKNYETTKK
jgi:methylase of polypeptide subunit release factors